MDSENKKAPLPRIKTDRSKAIAMTRAFDMLSEEFIENFQQTGKDVGPDQKPKPFPEREALAAREKREAEEENKKGEEKQEFRGFASLLANANKPDGKSAFARLLGDESEPATPQAPTAQPGRVPATPGQESTADGGIIKVKETSGKKRGLYTSCMQRPSAEQWQEMADKFGKKGSAAPAPGASPVPAQASAAINYTESVASFAQSQAQAPGVQQVAAPPPASASPFARPADPDPTPSQSTQSQQAQSQARTPSPYSLEAVQAYNAAHKGASQAQSSSSGGTEPEVQDAQGVGAGMKPAANRSKIAYSKECPIACSLNHVKEWWHNALSWWKGILGR